MALNVQTFKTRALTSVVFVVVMLAGLFLNRWSFIILFTIIHFGCWYEFIKLIRKMRPHTFGYILPAGLVYITLPILIMLLLAYPMLGHVLYQHGYEDALDFSPVLPCGIIFSIWINDTMAYIVGSLIGKTPLTSISPKKTWEGTIGGVLLCVIAISFGGSAIGYYSFTNWLIMALCCAVFGTFGDLLESKFKRMAGVKDSGRIMPGHGGFLDRFDSLLIATPVVGLYFLWFVLP
jgi:phosphatidate cytidylyltransferase